MVFYAIDPVPQDLWHKIRNLFDESNIPLKVDIIDFYLAEKDFIDTATKDIKLWQKPVNFSKKLNTLQKALSSFSSALELDYSHLSELEIYLIEGGQIQKFEYTLELFWKTSKTFLYGMHGIEALSPQMVMKELYYTKYISEEE